MLHCLSLREGLRIDECNHNVLWKQQQSRALSLAFYPDTFPLLSRCQICAFPSDLGTEWWETVESSVPIQAALSWGCQTSLAAWPLHRDSAGFNYPQLCFISLPSWAACPSVLCKYTAFTLKSRWDTQASAGVRAHVAPYACMDEINTVMWAPAQYGTLIKSHCNQKGRKAFLWNISCFSFGTGLYYIELLSSHCLNLAGCLAFCASLADCED